VFDPTPSSSIPRGPTRAPASTYTANDPDNPIGDRWIGLEGVSEAIRDLTGYGIHGTIEPESIGRQESMGCIRLRNDDVELLYEMLVERESTVEVIER
jgi:lipoprotein-anchoring transpeptidase ErfK/SrfK